MAENKVNNTYSEGLVLSKVQVGDQTYWLKDADVRGIIDNYGTAVNYNVDTTFNADSENLATSKAIDAYVTGKVAGFAGAMHFVGVKTKAEFNDGALAGNAGDIVIVEITDDEGNLTASKEYVYDGDEWVLIGDEGIYATIQGVKDNYVAKTFTIAGLDMDENIKVEDLQAALALKALAYKDSATGTLTDYATGINDITYTPAGSVEVELSQTSTVMTAEGTYTPTGTIAGNVTAAGSVSIARDDTNGTAVSGTVSAPTITVTPKTEAIQHIASLGELPTYTPPVYTAPSVREDKGSFAKSGLNASMDGETLVLTAADTSQALTATNFNPGNLEGGDFYAGALPAFGDAKTIVTGIESAEATAPTFTGDKFGATFAGSQVAISADFTGTESNVSVSGNYDKANFKSATFTGSQDTIKPTLITGNKAVTVQ